MVEYKQGCENKVDNALSRREESVSEDSTLVHPASLASLFLISFPRPFWIEELKASYQHSAEVQQLLHQLQSGFSGPKLFSLHNGLILYKGRVYLDPTCSLKPKILHQVHDSPLGGHSGFLKSFHRLKQDLFWVGMKSNLKQYIRECAVCQQMKHETCSLAGLLQPLSIPDKPWSAVSMDFISGLPPSQMLDTVMVVVDRLTKYVHFIGLSHPYSIAKVAALFTQNILKLQGMPTSIVSDRDLVFTAKF